MNLENVAGTCVTLIRLATTLKLRAKDKRRLALEKFSLGLDEFAQRLENEARKLLDGANKAEMGAAYLRRITEKNFESESCQRIVAASEGIERHIQSIGR